MALRGRWACGAAGEMGTGGDGHVAVGTTPPELRGRALEMGMALEVGSALGEEMGMEMGMWHSELRGRL